MALPRGKSRCFVITINNWTEKDYKLALLSPYRYIIIGRERGENNVPHLQIYVEMKNPISFRDLKRLHFPRAHIEPKEGTQTQAANYCKKEHYHEYGHLILQGTRNDLLQAKSLLDKGIPIRQALEDGQILTTGTLTAYEKLQRYYSFSRLRPRVFWIYGPGGSGKTDEAYHLAGTVDVYKADLINKGWMDGYDAHRAIIIDDLDIDPDDKEAFALLLALLDKNPYRANVKNSSASIRAETICITSQQAPWQIWKNWGYVGEPGPEMYDGQVELRQIMRRITEVIHLSGENIKLNYPIITHR